MASPRAKNTASPKEVAKLFRGANVTQLPPEENYMVADLSKVAEKYEDLLSDIIRCTPRPNVTLLQDACCLVFRGVTKADCKAFCQQLICAIKMCREKKSATTGKKLAPSVYRILRVLRMQTLAEAAAGDSQKTTESKGEVTPEIGPSKTARTSSKSASSNSKQLPLKEEQLSPKSKVLKAYGMQGAGAGSRVLQKNDSGSGVVEINAVYSSPSLYELSSGEEGPPKQEDPPVEAGSRVPFKEYYDDGKGCKVRAYENGKIEEISVPDPVYVRHRSKQPPKKVKKSEKKNSDKKKKKDDNPTETPEELEQKKAAAERNQAEVPLHRVRVATAKQPARSYVTACFCTDSKHRQSLLVEYSEKHFADHKTLVNQAKARVEEGMTFQQARAFLLKEKEEKMQGK